MDEKGVRRKRRTPIMKREANQDNNRGSKKTKMDDFWLRDNHEGIKQEGDEVKSEEIIEQDGFISEDLKTEEENRLDKKEQKDPSLILKDVKKAEEGSVYAEKKECVEEAATIEKAGEIKFEDATEKGEDSFISEDATKIEDNFVLVDSAKKALEGFISDGEKKEGDAEYAVPEQNIPTDILLDTDEEDELWDESDAEGTRDEDKKREATNGITAVNSNENEDANFEEFYCDPDHYWVGHEQGVQCVVKFKKFNDLWRSWEKQKRKKGRKRCRHDTNAIATEPFDIKLAEKDCRFRGSLTLISTGGNVNPFLGLELRWEDRGWWPRHALDISIFHLDGQGKKRHGLRFHVSESFARQNLDCCIRHSNLTGFYDEFTIRKIDNDCDAEGTLRIKLVVRQLMKNDQNEFESVNPSSSFGRPKSRTGLAKRMMTKVLKPKNRLSDVTIICDGGQSIFQGHKLILSVGSTVLAEQLTSSSTIDLSDFSSEAVKRLLKYFYKSFIPKIRFWRFSIEIDILIEIYNLAEKYQVVPLRRRVKKILETPVCCGNAVKLYLLSLDKGWEDLKRKTVHIMRTSLDKVRATQDWKELLHSRPELAEEVLVDMIKKPELSGISVTKLKQEQTLFEDLPGLSNSLPWLQSVQDK